MDKSGHAEYYQVYVWDLPLRFFHWINAACVFVLGVTGLAIGSPLLWQGPAVEASSRYLFGSIRFIHFGVAYVFLVNFLARIYWGFAGNDFARWKNFFPGTKAKRIEILQVLCLDIFMICKLPVLSIGANALAGVIYSLMYLAILFQILTGFALYSVMSPAWFPHLFGGLIPLFGGLSSLRQWHHVFTWIFVAFTTMHIYLSWYHDYLEGRGTISSMIGGWKFIETSTFPHAR
jgi:Ni/Fe-hydrogenase 1 B-type cytochrome subunit